MSESRPLRLILHAGLHKSGTTTFQRAMRAAYGSPVDGVWFPLMADPGFGHEVIAWTLQDALDDALRVLAAGGPVPEVAPVHLRALIEEAIGRGVEVLVVSAEDIDQFDERDAESLRSEIGEVPTTLLLTVTPPAHRWYSGWQEWVKHGGCERPLDGQQECASRSLTAPGAVRRLVSLLPHDELVVRLVRPSPPEPDLVHSLLNACGIRPMESLAVVAPVNVGTGVDIEVLRRLNALGVTSAVPAHERLSRFEVFRAAVRRVPGPGGPRPGYGLPTWFLDAARDEVEVLRALGRGAEATVLDPHGLLEHWEAMATPEWIDEIERSDWPEIPDVDGPGRR
jgi:hypothetical protein